MRTINFYKTILVVVLATTLFSCYKDKGNYDYTDREEFEISGIESSYTKLGYEESLNLIPSVKSNYPGAEFEYLWTIYDGTTSNTGIRKIDTIAQTHELNYRVDRPAGEWILVFTARNKTTGYAQIVRTKVTVTTQFTRGWYVIKDDGTETDVDLFTTPATLSPDIRYDKILKRVNGHSLEGKSGSLSFHTTYKSNVTGSFANTRAFFFWSDKDAVVVDINTFRVIRDFNTLFFEVPAVRNPTSVFFGQNAIFMINNGKVHSIFNTPSNSGIFGPEKLSDDFATPYSMSKYFLGSALHNGLFYDELSSTFFSATGNGSVFLKATSSATSKMPASNINKKMLYMGQKSYSTAVGGFAVLHDKTNPDLRILAQVSAPMSAALTITPDTLLNTSNLYYGEKFTVLHGDENLMYFSKGGQIWSRNLSNKVETLQYTLPAGEEVSFIRHRKFSGSAAAEQPYYHNFVIVGSKVGSNYKIRMFAKVSGNISGDPQVVLEGEGAATDVLYLSPVMAETVNQPSY